MASLVVYYTVVCILVFVITVEESNADAENLVSGNKTDSSQISQLSLYRKVFKQKRLEQMIAVENILKMNNYEQQYKIIKMIFEKIFLVIEKAKQLIAESGYVPGEEFPNAQQHKEAIGQIVENTAFFGDVVLRLPDITHKIFGQDKNWELLALWSISFTNSTTIYDEVDSKLIHLMAQELRLIPREPNFFNPFTEKAKHLRNKVEDDNEVLKPKKKDRKKKKTKGPRLSHADL